MATRQGQLYKDDFYAWISTPGPAIRRRPLAASPQPGRTWHSISPT